MIARPLLVLPVLLAACGDLPEPFLGNPGATARRLAVPVTPMLAVPPPARAALTEQGARDFADLLALSLVKEEVPALARAPQKNDWRLVVTAGRENDLGCLWPGDDGEAPDGPATGQGDDEDGSAVYERTGQR